MIPKGLIDAAAALHIEPAALYAAGGVAPSDLEDADAMVPAQAVLGMWMHLIASNPSRPIGVELGEHMPTSAAGIAGFCARHAPTGREALRRFTRYARLFDPFYSLEAEELPNETRLYQRHQPQVEMMMHPIEAMIAVIVRETRVAVAAFDNPIAVELAHAHAASHTHDPTYERVLGVVPKFGASRTCLVLTPGILDVPNEVAELRLGNYLEAHANDLLRRAAPAGDGSASATVSAAIERRLERQEEISAETIAEEMQVSLRTLQRRLSTEGAAFGDVFDHVRHRSATRLLEGTTLPALEIAFALGYAETTSFFRAFKRWTGTTPQRFRAELGAK